jgi:hypothetical protein
VPYSTNALWTTYYGIAFKVGNTGYNSLTVGTGGTSDVALGGNINVSVVS